MAFNYDGLMNEARQQIEQGMYTAAMLTLAKVLENLYVDFYRGLLTAASPNERNALTSQELTFISKGDKTAKEKGVDGLTLGGKSQFYSTLKIIDKAQHKLKKEYPHFNAFDPQMFIKLRNDTAHSSLVVTEDEANFFYSQMRLLLVETGFIQRIDPHANSANADATGLGDWKKNGVIPTDDILQGNLQMDTYAADLWGVARNDPNTPAVYRDPVLFFEQTYLTKSLESLIGDVLRAMAGGAGDRVLQLRTPFGGGKTHSLIALYHVAHSRKRLAKLASLAKLPDPGESAVAAVQCEKFDALKGHPVHETLHIHTLWGELAYQLAGEEGYTYFADSDQTGTAPGGETISQFLRDLGRPVLILLDEVLNHVEAAQTVTIGHSTLGRQLLLFLKSLTEAVSASRNTVLVYSLQASRTEALGSSGLLEDLDHLVSRIDAKRVPVSDQEVVKVVQRRLFKSLGDESAMRRVASAYADAYKKLQRAASLSPDEQKQVAREADDMAERILNSYPFHPDLLQLMYYRWGSRPSYQRTRGALQFLASVVYDLWHIGRDLQPLIGTSDVMLDAENTRNAFFTQVGERENYSAVLDADVSGTHAQAKHIDRQIAADSPNLQHFRIGTRLASSVMLYSFGAQEGEDRGVSEADLLKSVVAPSLERVSLVAALVELRQQLLYMHYTGRRYRFETQPNLNLLINRAAKDITAEEIWDRVQTVLKDALRDAKYAILWPEQASRVNDRNAALQVVYARPNWARLSDPELCELMSQWTEYAGSTRRSYKNGLAFAIPDYTAGESVQRYAADLLAIEQVIQNKRLHSLNAEMMQELNERQKTASSSLKSSVAVLYNRVAVPELDSTATSGMPYTWQFLQINERREAQLEPQILGALSGAHKLFESVTPDKIVGLTHLGDEGRQWLAIEDIIAGFYSYLDFTRLTEASAIQAAISRGVREGKFAYTAVFETQDGQLYCPKPDLVYFRRDVRTNEIELTQAILIAPDFAQALLYTPETDVQSPTNDLPATSNVSSTPTWSPSVIKTGSAPQGQAGVTKGQQRYRLQMTLDKAKVFKAFRAIHNLVERADQVHMTIDIEAVQAQGFDAVWLRNAVEEPLDEADIQFGKRLE